MADRSGWGVAAAEGAAVVLVLAIGVGLRSWHLELGWFGVDQARDAATGLAIADGSLLPTMGPTMRRVLHLGAGYYYFWALPYLVSTDPLAGFRFAAVLAVAAMVVTWMIGRRLWGALAGVVTLAVAAAHPVWVIDGRVLWSPAALPVATAVVLVLLCWDELRGRPARDRHWPPLRAGALGAVLGLVVQLHLVMVALAGATALLVLADRPRPRSVLVGVAAGLATGWPALAALLAGDPSDAGVASLATRGPLPSPAGRLAAYATLPTRLLRGLGGDAGPLVAAASIGLAILLLLGAGRLLLAALRGDRPARVLVVLLALPLAGAALLPGECWYYYLDGVLPLAALVVGAGVGRASAGPFRTVRVVAAAGGAVVALALTAAVAGWLGRVAAQGYLDVEPAWLSLDGVPGRDAAQPGRLLTAGVKRATAEAAARSGLDYPTLWQRLHGPAFGDLTGDNGFWLDWATRHAAGAADSHHFGVWYRDDPEALAIMRAAAAGVETATIGPLLLVRWEPALDYASCRDAEGPVVLPLRLLPRPLAYGDGTTRVPATLPSSFACRVRGRTRVGALLGRPDAGTVVLGADGAAPGERGWRRAACARATVDVGVTLAPGRSSDLDLYDVPDGGCAG